MKKVYIAGPDVFRPDAVEHGRRCKAVCAEYGLIGLYPFDNEADTAEEIFKGNCALIDECDIVCANLNPFRGDEPDSGTCFELGYGHAKGKALYGYLEDMRSLRQKLGEADAQGNSVEDFDLPVNLMMGIPVRIVKGDFSACIKAIAEDRKGE